MSNPVVGTTSTSTIQSLLWNTYSQQAETMANMKIRRALVVRDKSSYHGNGTGTILPPPFDQSGVALKTILGEMATAVQTAATRLTANRPDIQVVPLTTGSDISVTVDKVAGMQERLDSQMWHECGGMDAHWEAAWAKSIGGAAFWLTLPRDADFGLPNRDYYSDSDEAFQIARQKGIVGRFSGSESDGKMIYAEDGDVWAARRNAVMRNRAINGRSLFTLSVYPRDMVLKERDREAKDLKWGAIVEEIPANSCAPGSDFAMQIAKAKGLPDELAQMFGVFYDKESKRVIGGIPKGGPLNSMAGAYEALTLIRWFDRKDQVILVAPRGSVQGATELWRGEHGCNIGGVPACPLVEDAFYRTDINVTGKEYSSALDPVFAYVPNIDQLMTLLSNVATYNGIPRLVGELQNGATLRGDSGEPEALDSAPTPGLDPQQIAFYPGKISQLLISAETLIEALKIYFDRLERVMPRLGAADSSADAAGWAIMQRVQESQQPYDQPVRNFCQATTGIIQRWHGWERSLPCNIYFFAAPGHRKSEHDIRGLIEFDPKNLTDSVIVSQDIYTPSEKTVREQVQMEKWKAQLIDDEEYYETTGEQDAREAVIRRWVQIVTNYVMTGALPPTPSGAAPTAAPLIQIVADAVRGAVHYEMINRSPNYAIGVAEGMVAETNAQPITAIPGGSPMPNGIPNVANALGARTPGIGMNESLQGQLGPRVGAA